MRFLTCLSFATSLVGSFGCGGGGADPTLGSGQGGAPITIGSGGSGVVLTSGGAGGLTSSGGSGGADCSPQPVGLLRDFKVEHPDFEYALGDDRGIVQVALGADKKPVFAGGRHPTVTNATNFDQWYRDTPNVNMTSEFTLPFTASANGHLVYDNQSFFPLDGQGFGNEGNNHNFHFTFELHMEFNYHQGDEFTFRGDDDVFVFVNNKRAIDLGGVHTAESETLKLDERAAEFGITPGNRYPIDFFQAERHTSESSFRIETTLAFTNCTPIIVR